MSFGFLCSEVESTELVNHLLERPLALELCGLLFTKRPLSEQRGWGTSVNDIFSILGLWFRVLDHGVARPNHADQVDE